MSFILITEYNNRFDGVSGSTAGIPAESSIWCTCSWSYDNVVYEFDHATFAFIPNQTDYCVYVYATKSNVIADALATYEVSSGATAGAAVTNTLPGILFTGKTSGTFYIRVRNTSRTLRKNYVNNIKVDLYGNYNAGRSTATVDTVYIGEPQTITILNSYTASTLYHKVQFEYGTVSSGIIQAGSNRSVSWSVPSASIQTIYAANPNQDYALGTITVWTYSDSNYSTQIGTAFTITPTDESPPRLNFPNSSATQPTASISLYITPTGTDPIQNISTLTITGTGTPQAGAASITRVRITTPDINQEFTNLQNNSATVIISPLRTSGLYPISVTVTDSRGLTGSASTSTTILPNPTPSFVSANADRCDANMNITDEGTYVLLRASVVVSRYAADARQSGDEPIDITCALDGRTYVLDQLDSVTPPLQLHYVSAQSESITGDFSISPNALEFASSTDPVVIQDPTQSKTMTFNSNGTFVFNYAPTGYSDSGTWQISNGDLIVVNSSSINQVAKCGATRTYTYHALINKTLDAESSYTASFLAVDPLNQQTAITINVSTAIYTIYRMAGGKGVAFGKVAERMGVEVTPDWNFYVHGQEIFDMIHPVGSYMMTSDSSYDPNLLWQWTKWTRMKHVITTMFGTDSEINFIYLWTRIC